MTRNEALEQFRENEKKAMDQIKAEFWNHTQEQAETLSAVLKQVFRGVRKAAEESEKEKIMFMYFSLLRTDVLNQSYHVLVQAFDARWYMDTEPVCLTFSLDFLFRVLQPFRDQCRENIRKYMGKVNQYDVENLYQDLVMECNSMLSAQLRFMFRDVEQNKDFSEIPKEESWSIRWGEYRDNSEVIASVDRIPKDQKEWERSVQKAASQEDEMVSGYWYKTNLKDSICQNQCLYFTVFEDCSLKHVVFDGSNLTGVRFKNCLLEECSFKGAVLRQADFEGCILKDNNFDGADMTHASFTEKEVLEIDISPEQAEVIITWQEVAAQ
ncbi:pentapeptide repeat-containing protein [Lacrimispora sp.]|uniref:pentapeptide repeat-containing protein n=1 Tax=Lacrimispora sp. TaxID=2719234 RepID=UPI002FDA59DE